VNITPFRILHVLDHSWPVLDGYAQRSRSIVTAQSQIGIQPAVVTSPLHQSDDPSATDTSLDGIRYFRTPDRQGLEGRAIQGRWPLLRELAVVRSLRRRITALLESEKFDLVHAHSPALCGLAAVQAAESRGIPSVYEIRAFWEDAAVDQDHAGWASVRYWLGRNLESRIVRRADAVVGIAQSILKEIEGRGVPSAKLFHVPNGVDVTRFTPRPRDNALGGQLGVNGTPTLGFLGTLFPWEGVSWLVHAAAALQRKGVAFKLLIIGDGAEAAVVKKAIQETGAESYISLLGRVPHEEVERYYSVIDVLVYPRHSVRLTELVTPLKPLEAMALGKAILGSAVGGIRELIEPEVSGILFEPGNVEDFCRQAARLLQDESLRRALGEQARLEIAKEKDWKTLARRYESVYEYASRSARKRP
jgi:PEP-CTERM/exosortase A-associated glycosyltransferase